MTSDLDDYQMPEGSGTTIGKCLTFAEIEGLLAAERERCAAVADKLASEAAGKANLVTDDRNAYFRGQAYSARCLSETIRNLPPQTEGGRP